MNGFMEGKKRIWSFSHFSISPRPRMKKRHGMQYPKSSAFSLPYITFWKFNVISLLRFWFGFFFHFSDCEK